MNERPEETTSLPFYHTLIIAGFGGQGVLIIGNLFAFAVGPKGSFRFTLLRTEKMASDCYDFVFRPDRKLVHRPGQYLDWTLDVRMTRAKEDASVSPMRRGRFAIVRLSSTLARLGWV